MTILRPGIAQLRDPEQAPVENHIMLPTVRYPGPPSELFELNTESPQANGLVAWWAPFADRGALIAGRIAGTNLAIQSGGWGAKYGYAGLVCDANDERASVTAPDRLRLPWPITIHVKFIPLGSPTTNSGLFGISYDDSDGYPYGAVSIVQAATYKIVGNDGGTYDTFNMVAGASANVGKLSSITLVCTAAEWTAYFNGRYDSQDIAARSNPTYGATAKIFMGNVGGTNRNSNVLIVEGRIYACGLSAVEIAAIRAEPWDLYRPVKRIWSGFTQEDTEQRHNIALPHTTRVPKPPDEPFEINMESPQADGLVMWWPTIDDAGSKRHIDRVRGLEYAETGSGSLIWQVNPQRGYMLHFDNDSMHLEAQAAPITSTPVTLSIWLAYDPSLTGSWIAHAPFAVQDPGFDDHGEYFSLQTGLGSSSSIARLRASTRDSVSEVYAGADITRDDNLHHLLGVFRSPADRELYLDGISIATNTDSATPSGLDRVLIGARMEYNIAFFRFYGQLADARIYNKALSDSEIWQLFDPATRYDLYKPLRKLWAGWSEEQKKLHAPAVHIKREIQPPSGPFELNQESPQSVGLVGWWPLSGNYRSYDGRNWSLTNTGSTSAVDEQGPCRAFDPSGSIQTLEMARQWGAPFTFSAWVKVAALTSYAFMGNGYSGSSSAYEGLVMAVDGKVGITNQFTGAVSTAGIYTSAAISADEWTLLTGYLAGSKIYGEIYVNGILDNSGACDGYTTPTTWFNIGCQHSSAGLEYGVNGWMRDVRVYDGYIAPDAIWAMYAPATRWELYKPIVPRKVHLSDFIAAEITSVTAGTTCWGHSTGVTQTNTREFADNWTGTGEIDGSGDSERLILGAGEYMESEVIETGAETIQIAINQYNSGDTVTIQYRTGATVSACEGAGWSAYSAPFVSSGYVQIKLISTL